METEILGKGAVRFKCPKCAGQTIVRTANDRKIVAKYTCAQCGFVGPN